MRVEVAEEDLLRATVRLLCGGQGILSLSLSDFSGGSGLGCDLTSSCESPPDALRDQGHDDQRCYDESSQGKQKEAEKLSTQEIAPFTVK